MKLKQNIAIALISCTALATSMLASADDVDKEPEVTAKQAINIALEKIPGSVREIELEDEENQLVWEIELQSKADAKEYELIVDATTGEILKTEMDEDDDSWSFSFFDNDKS